ncbi:hypothetical protein FAES_3263 [Fibrella aestuarina BUZ 2]|uniref:Uncharacterized protein n=1 Tax=Fibrella aestuarina BUZ 2 TaxID=1166018 RepID=I0KAW9_9BACT|nr:hypothetical protein FAES_3263 [Fibrella aestuarina BUZ 2]
MGTDLGNLVKQLQTHCSGNGQHHRQEHIRAEVVFIWILGTSNQVHAYQSADTGADLLTHANVLT